MNVISIQYYVTPYGELILGSYENTLCLCDWRYRKSRRSIDRRITKSLNADYVEQKCILLDRTKKQLGEYFSGKRKHFDLPMHTIGTEFQNSVWSALANVPYGCKLNYSQLARNAGSENAIRAVANANGANALSIIIPCHRIIGSDGTLTGYAGGINAKKGLLDLECEELIA